MSAIVKKQDFTSGKILKKLILFAIPMAIATFLQMLFNAADIAIVGQFGGSNYQAAVGATSSTVHLIVNLFVGISVGANVTMANAYGAKDEEKQYRVTHTAMATSFVSGIFVLIVGALLSRPILTAIKTPAEIIDYSVMYMQLYFVGAPALLIYNFAASLMRAVGETKKPLYYLLVSGVMNVVINAVTVIFLDWHVVGVGLGTAISQIFAAAWIVFDLIKGKYGVKYIPKQTRFYKAELKRMLHIGIPMGISSCMFSLSNLSIQSSINDYGEIAIAGNTVGCNVETIGEAFASSVEKSVVTIVGQHVGAEKPDRIPRVIGAGLFACATCQLIFASILFVGGRYVCMIYNSDPVVIDWAMKRVFTVGVLQILYSLMYSFGAALRGMGYSIFPMLINLFFTCIVRIIYVFLIYANFAQKRIEYIYIIYPITWVLSGGMQTLTYLLLAKKQGHFKKKTVQTE